MAFRGIAVRPRRTVGLLGESEDFQYVNDIISNENDLDKIVFSHRIYFRAQTSSDTLPIALPLSTMSCAFVTPA